MHKPKDPDALSGGPANSGGPVGAHVGGSAAGSALVGNDHNVVSIVYGTESFRQRPPSGVEGAVGGGIRELRIFLSSPGDVAYERQLAREVAKELVAEPFLRGQAMLTIVSWDDPVAPVPLLADRTPQESVNRGRPRPSECDIVVVILWSRLGTPLPDEHRNADGRRYLSGTEWEFEDALKATARPDIVVYRREEKILLDADDPDLAAKLAERERVLEFFARFRNPDGSLLGGITRYDTPTAFAERLKKDLRELVAARLRRPSRAPSGDTRIPIEAVVVQPWTGSPYPGLRAFTSDEAAVFFGRGRELDALFARLREPAQRFLAIIGASGSGKSSLVRAGLLPRLATGVIEGSQLWRVLAFTPGASGDNPLLALAAELKGMLPEATQKPQIEIARALAEAPRRLSDYANILLANRPADAALVLFIDQFEELFTAAAEGHRRSFVELLTRAAEDPRLRLLVTLRADFLPQCATEPQLATLLQAGTFVLGPPGPAALLDMIRRPAERAGLALEEGLADAILQDAGSDPGEALPLVAFCLEELHRRAAPKRPLSMDAYRAMGGLRGAIGRRASELLDEFRAVEGADCDTALPQVFRALVHVDATGKAARRRAPLDDLLAAPPPVPRLVETLINGRLLLAESAGSRAAVTWAHEALIEEWPASRKWLERDRARMQRVQRQLLNLASAEVEDRQHAAETLGRMGPMAVEAVPTLIAALGDERLEVRKAAIDALGKIGPAAAEAVPALVAAFLDSDAYIRHAAATALGEIGPSASEAVPTLITVLRKGPLDDRIGAAFALGGIGPAAAEAVPTLIVALGDDSPGLNLASAHALGGIGPATPEVAPALVGALSRDDAGVRRAAAEALGWIGPLAVRPLLAALNDTEEEVRVAAAQALRQMGPAAVPLLLSALDDADADIGQAAKAMAQIGRAAVRPLLAALDDTEEYVRRAVSDAFLQMGPTAVPALIAALADTNKDARGAATYALARIGPAAIEAAPALAALLGDRDGLVRGTAAYALARIGPAAVPVLTAVLGHPDPNVRTAANCALERIERVSPSSDAAPPYPPTGGRGVRWIKRLRRSWLG